MSANELLRKARLALPSPTGSGRPMSRRELADAINAYLWHTHKIKQTWDETDVGRLERGQHRWPGKLRREAFRAVLHAATDADMGFYVNRRARISQPDTISSPQSDGANEHELNRREFLAGVTAPGAAALVAAIAAPLADGGPPPDGDLGNAAATLDRVRGDYQHGHYKHAAETLPPLLALLAHRREEGKNSPTWARLDAQAHQVASALLLKSEQPVLAAVAAERSIAAARAAGDQLSAASSTRAVVHCLMATGHPGPAARLAAHTAGQLATCVSLDDAVAASVYGALLLRGAVAAARTEHHDHAQTLLDEAGRAALRLGTDRNLHWTAFGPTNVAAHRVAVALELGDAGTAVRLADTIDITKLALPERKATLLLDTARALTQWGKWERALDAIRNAEHHAPEEIRTRPAAHATLRDLASRAPAPLRPRIHTFIRTIGVAA